MELTWTKSFVLIIIAIVKSCYSGKCEWHTYAICQKSLNLIGDGYVPKVTSKNQPGHMIGC